MLSEVDVVGTSGRVRVADLGKNLPASHDEDTRQLPPVRAGSADAAAVEDGGPEPPNPHPRMGELEQRTLVESKLPVERLVGIADADEVANRVLRKPAIGVFRRRHVHERDLRSRRLDGRTITSDVGQRFAAEGSTEMAQEDQEHRSVRLHRAKWLRQRTVVAG